MRQADKPVEYALYTDGHGFACPENRLHFYAVAVEGMNQQE
jgi:dipeptidyl aminopeptidase/acylaminoacyl peptidase